LKYVLKTDLNEYIDFKKVFIDPVKIILDKRGTSNRTQKLLVNGTQTAGNIFDLESNLTRNIEEQIDSAIARYLLHFKDSHEGLIKKWPKEYSLSGWIICMQSGGELHPHMHENGWLSGSIYINVPPKDNKDSGSLVVCIEDDKNELISKKSKTIIDVNTGNLCLFPASLLHYTIPFESKEDRVVLAFDVLPKN
jgi:hypothetical protein